MKIGVLAFSFLPRMGGVQVFSYNLLQYLAEQGHDVHLFLPRRYIRELKQAGIPCAFRCHALFFDENRLIRHVPHILGLRLRQLQRFHRFDVWQVIGAHHAGNLARCLRGVPRVLRAHGDDVQKDETLQYGVRMNPAVEQQIREAVSGMECCVALTETVRDCYRELGVEDRRIRVIPNMFDPGVFELPVDRNAVREAYGIGRQQRFLLSTGRYHRKKGYEYIPEAARQLQDQGLDFHWLIVGTGVSVLEPELRKAGVQQRITLREGFSAADGSGADSPLRMPPPALIDLYSSADVFVMPSLLETFGMVLIEAMAAGLPVVTTDAPGCRDVVSNEANGLMVPCRDSAALAQAVVRICREEGLAERLRRGASESLSRYRIDVVAGQYEALYRKLTEGGKE